MAALLAAAYPAASARIDPGAVPAGASGDVPAAVVSSPSPWRPCDDADAVECADLEVPIDHADPSSPSVHLPVRRLPANDPTRRIGTLVVIAGGPGQRGTDLVRAELHADALTERFDIVSWDPRGSAGETRVDCISSWDPYVGVDRTPDTALERRALDAEMRALAERCRERHGPLLPHLGTLASALDLEHLRRMLEEPSISLLGLSHGSTVALTYASLFPRHTRAAVLDGFADPALDPGERELEQAAAFEAALEALLRNCRADPDCPIHGDGRPGQLLDELLAGLDEAPLPTADGRALTQSDAYEAVAGSLLRDSAARRRLLEALAAADGGDGGSLLDIATDVRQLYEASGLTLGSFMASYCADTAGYWTSIEPEDVRALTAKVRDAAPRLGAWLWSPPVTTDLPPQGLCAMQPVPPPQVASGGSGITTSVPLLVTATTGDAATPYAAARRAVSAMAGATLLTVEAEHHLAYPYAVARAGEPPYACVLPIVEAYLLELVVPAGPVRCDEGRR